MGVVATTGADEKARPIADGRRAISASTSVSSWRNACGDADGSALIAAPAVLDRDRSSVGAAGEVGRGSSSCPFREAGGGTPGGRPTGPGQAAAGSTGRSALFPLALRGAARNSTLPITW